jgi:DNA polymerase III sliding clamp (beta) subunit (PCNA family)
MDTAHYPQWEIFDPSELTVVNDLGGKLALVEWAAGLKELAPLCGININGEIVKATDRYKLAVVPLEIPGLENPVTIPAGMLAQILRQTGEVRVGFTEHQMLLMPNDTTQLRLVTFAGDYPTMAKLMNRERPFSLSVKKDELLAIVNRATLAAPGDRLPLLNLYIGKESIAAKVDGPESAVVDQIDIPGQAQHPRVNIKVTPKMLTDILNHAPNDSVTIHYDVDKPEGVLYINGGSGFECWMVARKSGE